MALCWHRAGNEVPPNGGERWGEMKFHGNLEALSQIEKLKKLNPSVKRAKFVGDSGPFKYGDLGFYMHEEYDNTHIFRPDGGPDQKVVHPMDVWIL
jgi:hypothetical protein